MVRLSDPQPARPIEVLWQSNDAIAVNKPAGIATQAPSPYPSMETLLKDQLDRWEDYLAFPHRLDRSVGGVLLVALTKRAARLLSAQFASRKTEKEYTALVHGTVRMDQPRVQWTDWIRKIDGQPRAEACLEDSQNAKKAVTDVSSLLIDAENELTRLRLRPLTGRMHQLRIQCAMRGHPIVGDACYASGDDAGTLAVQSGAAQDTQLPGHEADSRILLFADRLAFHDPKTGRRTEVSAPCDF